MAAVRVRGTAAVSATSVARAIAVGLILGAALIPARALGATRVGLRASDLTLARVGAPARIRDTVVTRRRLLTHASQAPSGGVYTTGDGSQPTILLSAAYLPDPAFSQALADFFGTLLHGDELDSLTVYVAPHVEMQEQCASAEVDSCYDLTNDTIYLAGETPPDGAAIPAIAAHEYGHHVANHRDNSPWNAGNWGPKYWATAENVCVLTRAGIAFPGDEGDNYDVNPGEAWAETYRVLNAQDPFSWPIVSDLFAPDQPALAAARRDVLDPWDGDEYVDRRARLPRRRRWKLYTLPVQNDGTIDIRLRSRGSLDADLYVYKNGRARKPLARSTRSGHRDRISGTVCGLRHVQVAVYRYKGAGSFSLRATLPYTTS